MTKFIVYTDGAARGNPGPAAASFIITSSKGEILVREGLFLGIATNNQAEYRAVKAVLEKLVLKFGNDLPVKVELCSDSTLVVNQLSGNYKIKNPQIKTFVLQIKQLESKVGKIFYRHIPRSQNALADEVTNEVLDKQLYEG